MAAAGVVTRFTAGVGGEHKACDRGCSSVFEMVCDSYGQAMTANTIASLEHTNLPRPPSFDTTAEERTYRKQQLAAAFRIFGKFGFSEGNAGHITARDPQHADLFWVNPFGRSFNQMHVSDLICVDHAGKVVRGEGPLNRAAFIIHSHIHQARPEVVAAAHAHSLYGKAFAYLGIPVDPITQDACVFYEDHALYANYGGVATEHEEGRQIAGALGSAKAAILKNHGLLTVGHTVAEAAGWFTALERTCQAQLVAMAAGTPIHIDHEDASAVRAITGTPYAGWFKFQPLWDQIVASDPDLFD